MLNMPEPAHVQRAQLMRSSHSSCVLLVCGGNKFLRFLSDFVALYGKPLHVPLSTGGDMCVSHYGGIFAHVTGEWYCSDQSALVLEKGMLWKEIIFFDQNPPE